MRLDELPDDILTMVLERSLVCKYCSFCFKANLVLAAISRQVRRAALPLVYREIYYRCTRGVRINQRSYYADGSVRPPDTEISGQIFSVDSIFGVGLTDLTVQRLISVDDMLALAGNLPRLERLSVRCDGCSTVQSDISLPKPSERSHPVHPLSTSIRWLYIDVRNERRRCSQRTALVKFILLKIPSLDLLDMTCADNAKLMRFNKSHKLWYPRLGTVKVESTKYFCGNGVGAAHMKAA
ncbi:hypothetical protein H4R19_003131 [Coemansia spiralis]|nr:hypothetical protein H4R19_003131 [Coemansia spiralis]